MKKYTGLDPNHSEYFCNVKTPMKGGEIRQYRNPAIKLQKLRAIERCDALKHNLIARSAG